VQTIGGGMVVEALAERVRKNRPNVYEDLTERAAAVGDDQRFVEYCLRTAESLAASPAELAVRAKLLRPRVQETLAELVRQDKAMTLTPALWIHRDTAAAASEQVVKSVEAFHRQTPESPGMTLDELRRALGTVPIFADTAGHGHAAMVGTAAKMGLSPLARDKTVLDGLLGLLKSQKRLVEANQRWATARHQATFSDEDSRQIEAIESLLREQAMSPPGVEELAAKTKLPAREVERLLKILREHGRVVQVAKDLLFHREAVDRARELLVAHLRKEGKLESVDFKYLLNTSRKFAIPLLDYFDQTGVTRRAGYTRYLKTK
jgi:selenocysteine-specific elongation factor